MPSARKVTKKWIDEVIMSSVFNEASLKSKKLQVVKCPRINLNYNPSSIFQQSDWAVNN